MIIHEAQQPKKNGQPTSVTLWKICLFLGELQSYHRHVAYTACFKIKISWPIGRIIQFQVLQENCDSKNTALLMTANANANFVWKFVAALRECAGNLWHACVCVCVCMWDAAGTGAWGHYDFYSANKPVLTGSHPRKHPSLSYCFAQRQGTQEEWGVATAKTSWIFRVRRRARSNLKERKAEFKTPCWAHA